MFYSKKRNKFEAPSMDYASLYPSTMKDYTTDREFMRLLRREERKRKLRQIDEIRESN